MYGTVEQFPGGQSRAALNTMVDFLWNGAKPEKEVNLLSPKLITQGQYQRGRAHRRSPVS